MKICHVTTAHSPHDIRIYRKEATSISKSYKTFIALNTNENVKNGDIEFLKLPKSNNRFLRFLKDGYLLYKKVSKENFDLIHFHDPDFILYAYLLSRQGTKIIYDVHEDVPRAIMSKYWIPRKLRKVVSYIFEKTENFFSKKFDYIVTATPFIKERFIRLNSNTEVINNYPLLNELNTANVDWLNKKKQVAYVGGLNNIRGVKYLAETSLKNPYDIKVAGKVKDLTYENNLKLVGQLNREEVKQLLNESYAGIVTFLPEPNHINSKPNKMFEYMSASLPLICSNFNEWKDFVSVNKNGISVDPMNATEISNAIAYLIENPLVAENMGKNGRRAIEEKYNWEVESIKLTKIYNQLLKEN
ncbi:MAG TPA: glycosyl transferase [Jeotgalicoccus sp.]|nr:glycosyl transferase [Jeotgalicoccus sp.]